MLLPCGAEVREERSEWDWDPCRLHAGRGLVLVEKGGYVSQSSLQTSSDAPLSEVVAEGDGGVGGCTVDDGQIFLFVVCVV